MQDLQFIVNILTKIIAFDNILVLFTTIFKNNYHILCNFIKNQYITVRKTNV